jgi:hypothetical protein
VLLLALSLRLVFIAYILPPQNNKVLKKCSRRFFFVLSPSHAVAALALSLSQWVLHQLLQVLSQCCDVRRFSMAPTIVTRYLACVCTCGIFDCGIFSLSSFPARHLLRLLLSL